jgi:antitoxin VapB
MIRADDVNELAHRLAGRLGATKTEAVRLALQHELQRMDEAPTFEDQIKALQDRVAAWPATGLEADKAFYDDLSGEGDI